jgi:hypothetical protein
LNSTSVHRRLAPSRFAKQFQPGFTARGSFAEFDALDFADTNLVRLSDDLDFATAARRQKPSS